MLECQLARDMKPGRVVVMGAGGFVGSAISKCLQEKGVSVVTLGTDSLNLLDHDAPAKLAGVLGRGDTIVIISAIAPCKNNAMLIKNITMMSSVCDALERVMPSHVVYISSDAVYADEPVPITESSRAEPSSLHGAMHLTREIMLKNHVTAPLAILRPSLLYGALDTHNGYGPNQFRRMAAEGRDIMLFGEGEERRDHVLIDDVAELVYRVVVHRSQGVLNVATGEVASFREVAEMVASHFNPRPVIRTIPRTGPMPHKGYRPFGIEVCRKAFPDFRYTLLSEGIAKSHEEMLQMGGGVK